MAERGLEEFAGEGDADLQIASQDFRRLEETRLKAGYVEGAAAGKDKCLQAGFSEGFARGVASALHWGMLRGRVRFSVSPVTRCGHCCTMLLLPSMWQKLRGATSSALQTHCTSRGLSDESQQLSALLHEISLAEQEWRKMAFADQLEQYRQAVDHLQFDSSTPMVPAVLPPVVADSAPMSEVVKAVPPPPPTLAVLQKKLEETKTKLQLN